MYVFPFWDEFQENYNVLIEIGAQCSTSSENTSKENWIEKRAGNSKGGCLRVVQSTVFPWGPQSVTEQHRNILPNMEILLCYIYLAASCVRCWSLTDCGPPGNTFLVVCTCLENSLQKLHHVCSYLQVFCRAAVHWALMMTINVIFPKTQIKGLETKLSFLVVCLDSDQQHWPKASTVSAVEQHRWPGMKN